MAAAISAAVLARSAERTPQWQLAAGTLIAAAAFGSYRLAGHLTGAPRHAAVAAGSGGALLVMAVSVHLALALPDGRLTRPPVPGRGTGRPGRPAQLSRTRRLTAILAYAAAIAAGLVLGGRDLTVSVTAGATLWAIALAATLPAVRLEYLAAAGRDRERLQWISAGAVTAAGLAIALAVLHLLVGWPVAVAATRRGLHGRRCPLGMIAGELRPLRPAGGRVLVQLIAVTGFTAVVAVRLRDRRARRRQRRGRRR